MLLADHTGDEVVVEVARKRAQRVGLVEVRRLQRLFERPVAGDDLEAGGTRPLDGALVTLDEHDLVSALAQDSRGSEPHAACTHDNV